MIQSISTRIRTPALKSYTLPISTTKDLQTIKKHTYSNKKAIFIRKYMKNTVYCQAQTANLCFFNDLLYGTLLLSSQGYVRATKSNYFNTLHHGTYTIDGNSVIGAHVRNIPCYLICLRHLICATCSELPSNATSTMNKRIIVVQMSDLKRIHLCYSNIRHEIVLEQAPHWFRGFMFST